LTFSVLAFLTVLLLFTGCERSTLPGEAKDMVPDKFLNGDIIAGKYIVLISKTAISESKLMGASTDRDRSALVREAAEMIFRENRLVSPIFDYVYGTAVFGFSGTLTENDARILASDHRVVSVEPDKVIALSPGKGKPNPNNPVQTVPWGITRVGGGIPPAPGKRVWIIDTGIDFTHPDLNVNTGLSATFVTGTSNASDQNGHGTHVAGTVGALNNTIGVIGVAPGVELVSVRVLNKNGSGTTSGVIAGVNYVAANAAGGDVANMSLGGGISTSLDQAVLNASNAKGGIWFSLAAGNESDNAANHSPARVNGPFVITVSAMDINDNWAYFSNFGSGVDWCAPGVSILSTWKGGGYNTISGTSMAAPHIAGLLVLKSTTTAANLVSGGTVQNDPDNNPDPIGHY